MLLGKGLILLMTMTWIAHGMVVERRLEWLSDDVLQVTCSVVLEDGENAFVLVEILPEETAVESATWQNCPLPPHVDGRRLKWHFGLDGPTSDGVLRYLLKVGQTADDILEFSGYAVSIVGEVATGGETMIGARGYEKILCLDLESGWNFVGIPYQLSPAAQRRLFDSFDMIYGINGRGLSYVCRKVSAPAALWIFNSDDPCIFMLSGGLTTEAAFAEDALGWQAIPVTAEFQACWRRKSPETWLYVDGGFVPVQVCPQIGQACWARFGDGR